MTQRRPQPSSTAHGATAKANQADTPASERHQTPPRTEEPRAERRPFKEVWMVEDRQNARSLWTRVGTAYENRDGSWNLRLSAVPVGGTLNVRDPREKSEADRAEVAA